MTDTSPAAATLPEVELTVNLAVVVLSLIVKLPSVTTLNLSTLTFKPVAILRDPAVVTSPDEAVTINLLPLIVKSPAAATAPLDAVTLNLSVLIAKSPAADKLPAAATAPLDAVTLNLSVATAKSPAADTAPLDAVTLNLSVATAKSLATATTPAEETVNLSSLIVNFPARDKAPALFISPLVPIVNVLSEPVGLIFKPLAVMTLVVLIGSGVVITPVVLSFETIKFLPRDTLAVDNMLDKATDTF